MNRVIITPAVLPSAALAELKQWLGITVSADDAPLGRAFAAALETCESFTGTMPLAQECEEILPDHTRWQTLATRPVQAITAVQRIVNGRRSALSPSNYAIELGANGTGCVRLLSPQSDRVVVSFTAGFVDEWAALPDGLRHGIVRLAAHQHRERDSANIAPLPPASVAALWRPWRRMRLA